MEGALISLDQEKALDRVDLSFMQCVLARMNFGPSFRGWIALLYTSIYSRVMVNDTLGAPFSISRGVRQGCPLSPLLYVLVAETLARAIKLDPKIDGFQLPSGTIIKLQQYADDTSCIVSSDASLCALFDLFARYERASFAKLIISKSKGLLLGSWTHRNDLPINLQWSKDFLTILGCRVGHNILPDWGGLLKSFESRLMAWKQRSLTLGGRALVANTLGLSLFWYQATIFSVPKTVIHEINKRLFNFIWNKSREPIARTSIVQPRSRGGLGVINMTAKINSLRVIWLRRLLTETYAPPWPEMLAYHINKVFRQTTVELFQRDTIPAYLVRQLPKFYGSLISTWVELRV